MANYCSNCIAFYGKEVDKLEHLKKMMEDSFNNDDYYSIRGFVMKYGYTQEEAYGFTDCRDTFIDIDDEISNDGEDYYFTIQTESAWNPNVDVFKKVIADYYGNEIEFVHCSEEPGFAVYINTDTKGRFYSDKYHLDYCIKEKYVMEYYTDFKEVIEVLKEDIPEIEFSIYDSIEDINDKVQKLVENNKDDYFTLYEYTKD